MYVMLNLELSVNKKAKKKKKKEKKKEGRGVIKTSMPTHIFVWGYITPRDWHLVVQGKIWGYTFWKSVIGVHTLMASCLIHGNSLYRSSWKFWPVEFSSAWIRHAFAKVYNFIVRLRLICPFRQFNLLCRCSFITVVSFMFFTTRENLIASIALRHFNMATLF